MRKNLVMWASLLALTTGVSIGCGGTEGPSVSNLPDGGRAPITDEELCQFKYGVSTRGQVEAAFGPPDGTTDYGTNSTTSYDYEVNGKSAFTLFSFDENDVLLDIVRHGFGRVPDCLTATP